MDAGQAERGSPGQGSISSPPGSPKFRHVQRELQLGVRPVRCGPPRDFWSGGAGSRLPWRETPRGASRQGQREELGRPIIAMRRLSANPNKTGPSIAQLPTQPDDSIPHRHLKGREPSRPRKCSPLCMMMRGVDGGRQIVLVPLRSGSFCPWRVRQSHGDLDLG